MTLAYRYRPAAIAWNYGRSAIGLIATLVPLAVLEPAAPVSAVLVAVAGLFLVYLARSIALSTRTIKLDASGMRTEGLFAASVPWESLQAVRLGYYSTRKDGSHGWIELVVRGTRGSIRADSRLDGFAAIAERAAREALARGLALDERTCTHLAVLGIGVDAPAGAVEPLPGARHA